MKFRTNQATRVANYYSVLSLVYFTLLFRTAFCCFLSALQRVSCVLFRGGQCFSRLSTQNHFLIFKYNSCAGGLRVQARILNLADGYPAFGMNASDDKTNLHIAYPDTLSRGLLLLRLFFGFIYVIIPHGFLLFFRVIATYFLVFIAWWAVLFTGEYPKGMHEFVTGTFRWAVRVQLYMMFMTDKYPPFSGK